MDGKGPQKEDSETKGKAQIIAMQIREFHWEFKLDPILFCQTRKITLVREPLEQFNRDLVWVE